MLPDLPPMLALFLFLALVLGVFLAVRRRVRGLPQWARQISFGLSGAMLGLLFTVSGPVLADARRIEEQLRTGVQFPICFEGSTFDAFQTCVTVVNPTADRTVTMPNVTGTIITTGDTGSVTAAMVANVVRSVPLPLNSWFDGTSVTMLSVDEGADAQPDIAVTSSVPRILYDVTGGSIDTNEICTTFVVPADYASGGSIKVRARQAVATVTQVEAFSCRASLSDGAISVASSSNLANVTTAQTITSTPAITWAAGESIGVCCKQGNAVADDAVAFLGIEGSYTATQ